MHMLSNDIVKIPTTNRNKIYCPREAAAMAFKPTKCRAPFFDFPLLFVPPSEAVPGLPLDLFALLCGVLLM